MRARTLAWMRARTLAWMRAWTLAWTLAWALAVGPSRPPPLGRAHTGSLPPTGVEAADNLH